MLKSPLPRPRPGRLPAKAEREGLQRQAAARLALLLQVALVVFLSAPEGRGAHDLSGDRAAVGAGLWPDFRKIDDVHQVEDVARPIPGNVAVYEKLLPVYARVAQYQSELGDMLTGLEL